MNPEVVGFYLFLALGSMVAAVALVVEGARALPLVLLLCLALAVSGVALVLAEGRSRR